MLLDSGDLFHSQNSVSEGNREQVRAKAELYFAAYGKLGYAGLGLGDRDLGTLGVEAMKELAAKATFPLLNANVVDQEGKAVFTPFTVITAGGFKLGLFGLVTGGAQLPGDDAIKYKVLAPAEAARTAVDALAQQNVDAVILLSHLDKRDLKNVLKAVDGIDLSLGGQSPGTSRSIDNVGNTWAVETGQKGQNLGMIVLNMPENAKRPFVVREASEKLKQELTTIDQRIKRYKKMIEGPERPGTRTQNKSRFKSIVQTMLKQREDLVARARDLKKAREDAPFLAFEMLPVKKELADDPALGKLVEEFKAKHPQAPHGRPKVGRTAPDKVRRIDPKTMKNIRPITPGTTAPPPAGH